MGRRAIHARRSIAAWDGGIPRVLGGFRDVRREPERSMDRFGIGWWGSVDPTADAGCGYCSIIRFR